MSGYKVYVPQRVYDGLHALQAEQLTMRHNRLNNKAVAKRLQELGYPEAAAYVLNERDSYRKGALYMFAPESEKP